MRIAYLAHWTGGTTSGVTLKIAAQALAWSRLGARVRVVAYGGASVTEFTAVLEGSGIAAEARSFTDWRERSAAIRDSASRVVEWGADVVYFRQDLWSPAIERLAGAIPLVLEVNTDDLAEARLGRLRRRLFLAATRDRLLRRAAAGVFVTAELGRSPRFAALSGPRLVLGNGIDLDQVRPVPPPRSPVPALAFVAAEHQAWHGLDKLVALAGARPEWRFNLVGNLPVDNATRFPNLRMWGALGPVGVRQVLADSDVGVGPLALHRKGMSEASPLKAREYLAAGLPVLSGYTDTDFPGGAPFLLELPNEEANVLQGLDRIDEFVARWKGRRVERPAIQHLDVMVKESLRLDFLRQAAGC